MLRTLICDDEPPALELLAELLSETGNAQIVHACSSAREALAAINRGGIDLVVLDIEMPELNGVDVYSLIEADPKPLVIFATAHPEYAVEAFGADAIDYLLKPLESERVNKAVTKAARLHRMIMSHALGEEWQTSPPAQQDNAEVLKIVDAGRYLFIPYNDLIWIEAAGDYALLHKAKQEIAIRKTLASLEAELPSGRFLRVHRSAIIATGHMREIRLLPKGGAEIEMANGLKIRASRSHRSAIMELAAMR